jgi:hypothetical protein
MGGAVAGQQQRDPLRRLPEAEQPGRAPGGQRSAARLEGRQQRLGHQRPLLRRRLDVDLDVDVTVLDVTS